MPAIVPFLSLPCLNSIQSIHSVLASLMSLVSCSARRRAFLFQIGMGTYGQDQDTLHEFFNCCCHSSPEDNCLYQSQSTSVNAITCAEKITLTKSDHPSQPTTSFRSKPTPSPKFDIFPQGQQPLLEANDLSRGLRRSWKLAPLSKPRASRRSRTLFRCQ